MVCIIVYKWWRDALAHMWIKFNILVVFDGLIVINIPVPVWTYCDNYEFQLLSVLIIYLPKPLLIITKWRTRTLFLKPTWGSTCTFYELPALSSGEGAAKWNVQEVWDRTPSRAGWTWIHKHGTHDWHVYSKHMFSSLKSVSRLKTGESIIQ